MVIDERILRGANQVLFNYLPGQLVEYPQANVVVLVQNWGARPSELASKKRVLDKIYHTAFGSGSKYKTIDPAFPRTPDIKRFYFGEPNFVTCKLFPLVFTEVSSNRVRIFRNAKALNLFLSKGEGGKLIQRDLVFISPDGEMDQLQPIKDIRARPLKLEKLGKSQAALMWIDATTGKNLGSVFGIISGKRISKGTPARARRTFLPQIISLVNIRDYVDVGESEKETLGSLILARYIYGSAGEMSLCQAFEKLKKTNGMTAEKKVREYAEALGVDFDSLPEENKRKMLAIESTEMEQAKRDIEKVRSAFSGDEILNAHDEVYEFVETAASEGKITLQEMLDKAGSKAQKEMYLQFIGKLNDVGVCSATYLEDVPLINLSYGFVRGEFKLKETTLKPFPTDEFDKDRNRIPIYLTQMKSEGLLLEIDRRKIIEFLAEKGSIKEVPEQGKEKEWFIKNVDPTKVTRFSGVLERGTTRDVFNLIHTISHALMKQIPDQCGIGINQIGELIFPSIPIILIFSREIGDFRLGALKDLFEYKIYPWVDISFRASRSGSCIYDPVCFHGDGSCHSCLLLNEITCGYFNQGLSRHNLFGSLRRKTKGFWDGSLKKF